jgi:hypothetical protein
MVYAWAPSIAIILPLVFLPAVTLFVSVLRARRRSVAPSGDALALAILSAAATAVYFALLYLAAGVALAFRRVSPGVSPGAITPDVGGALALAGSLAALAGVIAGRAIAPHDLSSYAAPSP